MVSSFEAEAARALFIENGIRCVSTSSATAAIEIALQALELPPHSAVLIPSFTFVATAAAVVRMGHVPVFTDVEIDRWELTPRIAEEYLKKRAIKAVIPVTPFGYPINTAEWAAWSNLFRIPVIVDAAAGLGNQLRCEGLTAVFSMHATKPFGVGEGGLLATPSAALAADYRARTNFGMIDRIAQVAGGNAKLSEWHGAVARAQLQRWDYIRADLCRVREIYRQCIENFPLHYHPDCWEAPVPTSMAVRFATENLASAAIAALANEGIEARRWFYPLLCDHPAYRKWSPKSETRITVARSVASTLVSVPLHAYVRREDVERIARTIESMLERGHGG